MNYHIEHGEVQAVLAGFHDCSFDALLCDPPYGFSFMNKAWDYDVPSVDLWRECLRVLKPGAPLLSFGGTRTFHRLACRIEDAGFELRDCLTWLYGKGFPKSQNISLAIDKSVGAMREVVGTRILTGNAAVSLKDKGGTYGVQVGVVPPKEVNVTAPATDLAKEWEGWGTALKPGWEPIILARKPLEGTMVENVTKWGVGGLAIDACRIEWQGKSSGWAKSGSEASENVAMSGANYARAPKPDAEGRWPANLILDEDSAALLDATVGERQSTLTGRADPAKRHANPGDNHGKSSFGGGNSVCYADSGGPSRFFYSAKVSTKEREAGCEQLPRKTAGEMTGGREEGSAGLDSPHAGAGRQTGARNYHPTLKPISLTEYLARLIQPPKPGVLLVPFAGAGSEMIGAVKAGWSVLGIEREADYIAIAQARLKHWVNT